MIPERRSVVSPPQPTASRLSPGTKLISRERSRIVASDLAPEASASHPSVIFGLLDSGGSRIADGKQAMISEAIDKQFAAEESDLRP